MLTISARGENCRADGSGEMHELEEHADGPHATTRPPNRRHPPARSATANDLEPGEAPHHEYFAVGKVQGAAAPETSV